VAEEDLGKEEVTTGPVSQVNRALWLYGMLVILVTAVSWGAYMHRQAPDLRPLFTRQDRFTDLTGYADKVSHLRGGAAKLGFGPPTYNYPAPAAFVFKTLLYAFPGHAVRTYLTFLVICIVAFGFVAWRAIRSTPVRQNATAAIIITVLLGYPLWFTADRANTEGVVWALAGAGLCFLLRGRYRAAAVFIGLATSVKPFSILFLLLLVGRRKYKEAALGLATTAVLVVVALTVMGPTPWKAYDDLKPGVGRYIGIYVERLLPAQESRFCHSLLDGAKTVAVTAEMGGIRPRQAIGEVQKLMQEPGGWHVVHTLVWIYPFVVVVGFGLLLAVFYKMPLLNQMTALGVAVTLFPPVAGDYTLLHLYVPFGALVVFLAREVAEGKAELRYGTMMALATIYALLFSPLTFLMYYAGVGKMLVLLALLVVAARSPMRSVYFGDEPLKVNQ
jgi:hypothetical protein